MAEGIIEDLRREHMEERRRKKRGKKKKSLKRALLLVSCLLLLSLAGFLAFQIRGNRHFERTCYELSSAKINEPVSIAVLSDLHSTEYGKGNRELIDAVREEEPDFIAMAGDMVNKDDGNFSVILDLCRELKEIAPVYYVPGNHEGTVMYGRFDSVELDKILEEAGATVLVNEVTEFTKGDTTVRIGGISTDVHGYDRFAGEKLESFWDEEGYKLVLSHFPDLYYDKLKDADFDLALAGHYHGGIIRIPGLGGFYHPETGFFPRYSGGQYALTEGTLIVSRGIGGHGIVPRINNRPELVMIKIEPGRK